MPKYRVNWSELTHYTTEVDAADREDAIYQAMNNLGDYQEDEFGGIEENSIEVVEILVDNDSMHVVEI